MAFVNTNICRSFNQSLSTTLTPLSSQVCSEVLIINRTGQSINIYDSGFIDPTNSLLIEDTESITIRGITNSDQVSAQTTSGGGTLYYRTQYFSYLPQR
jgi:hypothetical protein